MLWKRWVMTFELHLLWIPNNNASVGLIYKFCVFMWKIFECYLILLAGLQGKDICTYATVLVLIWQWHSQRMLFPFGFVKFYSLLIFFKWTRVKFCKSRGNSLRILLYPFPGFRDGQLATSLVSSLLLAPPQPKSSAAGPTPHISSAVNIGCPPQKNVYTHVE